MVRKLPNVGSHGKPAIVFKKVTDIYEKDEAFKLQPSNLQSSQHSDSKSRSGKAKNKKKDSCVLHIEVSSQQLQPLRDEFVRQGADKEVGSDLEESDFGNIKLKQLRVKAKSKKRKRTCSTGSNSEERYVQMEADKDDSDLNKPLSSLKLKLSKVKRKRARVALESKEVDASDGDVGNPYSDMLVPLDNTSLDHVTREIQTVAPTDDFPSTNPENELSGDKLISNQMPMAIESETSEKPSFPEEIESCILDDVASDQLEDIELSSHTLPSSLEDVDEIHKETSFPQSLDLPIMNVDPDDVGKPLCMTFPTKDQNAETDDCSMALDLTVDDCNCMEFLLGDDSLPSDNGTGKSVLPDLQIVAVNGPVKEISCSHNENPCSSPENELFSIEECPSEEQRLIFNFAHRIPNCSDTGKDLVLSEENSTLDEEGQQMVDPNVCEQRDFTENCTADENPLVSVPVRPERLFLTYKVLSLTSEEQLSLALKSEELQYHQECEGDQGKEGRIQTSSFGSDINNASVAEISMASGSLAQTNGLIGHTSMSKKLKHERKQASSPKRHLEGPCLSRSLPNIDTGCASPQGCSESAIAFSQRQMQDINSLAMKLMTELRSVKDILENKLLLQAYRRTTTSDVEEVRKAIRNATKTEETTKKWLSMMARDCNRFCKIMSLTQKGTNAVHTTDNVVQREKKKISFADEAGGELCHVKFFKDDLELGSVVKQEGEIS